MKLKILLNWETARRDLFEPFVDLRIDFDFIVLHNRKPTGKPPLHPFKEIYYDDFKTPYHVLKAIAPDKIIFLNINSFPQIALNRAAKNKGINTFIIHHGVYSSDGLQISRLREALGIDKTPPKQRSFKTLIFYVSALRPKNIQEIIQYLKFPFTLKKNNRALALHKSSFDAIFPTKFIQLSPYNASVTKNIYGFIDDDIFIYIGHPGFDRILNNFRKLETEGVQNIAPYFLLIDFPNEENNFAFKTVGIERKYNFYKRLSLIAKQSGCRLKIKVHPGGYNTKFDYVDDNIDLYFDSDIALLIYNAKVCLSFYSTLLIPIIYQKKFCYVFEFGLQIGLQNELIQLGMARPLQLDNFSINDFNEGSFSLHYDAESYTTFVNRYLFYVDGQATNRLKEVLKKYYKYKVPVLNKL